MTEPWIPVVSESNVSASPLIKTGAMSKTIERTVLGPSTTTFLAKVDPVKSAVAWFPLGTPFCQLTPFDQRPGPGEGPRYRGRVWVSCETETLSKTAKLASTPVMLSTAAVVLLKSP